MNGHHDFCKTMLKATRQDAAGLGMHFPGLRAMRATRNLYLVEGDGGGEYVRGDCAWSAKAAFIERKMNHARRGDTNR